MNSVTLNVDLHCILTERVTVGLLITPDVNLLKNINREESSPPHSCVILSKNVAYK